MNRVFIAVVFAVGVGAWVYGKFQKSNGGLTQRSLIGAAVAGVIAFILFITLASTLLNRIA
jgi:hypothetical protein